MASASLVNTGSSNGLLCDGTKLLPVLVLTYNDRDWHIWNHSQIFQDNELTSNNAANGVE